MSKSFNSFTSLQLEAILQYAKFISDNSYTLNIEEFIYTLKSSSSTQSIYISGVGKNDPVAEKTANMLRSLGVNAHKLDCVHAMHGDMGMLRDNDIIICLSKSGNTAELIHFLEYVKTIKKVKIIGITSNEDCKFNVLCDLVYCLPVVELDQWDKIPTNSNIIYQMFLDSIILSAFEDTLSIEGFVKTHPGGAIGATVLP